MEEIVLDSSKIAIEEKVRYYCFKSIDWSKSNLIVKRFFITYYVYNEFFKRNNKFEYFNLEKDFPPKDVIIFYLDAPLEILQERIKSRGDKFISIDKLQTLKELYRKYLEEFSKTYTIIYVNNFTIPSSKLFEYVKNYGVKVFSTDWNKWTQESIAVSSIDDLDFEDEKYLVVENPDYKYFESEYYKVVETLKNSKTSRRAVVLTSPESCIIGAEFLVRIDELITIIFFRSFDVNKYLHRDLKYFNKLSRKLKSDLNLKKYKIFVNIGSAHYYIEDLISEVKQ
jgi:thymidylate synthase